jgi:hypothetical protein
VYPDLLLLLLLMLMLSVGRTSYAAGVHLLRVLLLLLVLCVVLFSGFHNVPNSIVDGTHKSSKISNVLALIGVSCLV